MKEIHVRSGMDVTLGQPRFLDPLESGAEYQAKRSEFIQALIRVRDYPPSTGSRTSF